MKPIFLHWLDEDPDAALAELERKQKEIGEEVKNLTAF